MQTSTNFMLAICINISNEGETHFYYTKVVIYLEKTRVCVKKSALRLYALLCD